MCGSRLSFPFSLFAQFTYTIDQSIPVEVSGKTLLNPWAGGLNAAQVNTMDLNADGQADLVIFDKTASKISTFVALNNAYRYAPEYEILFPSEISTFAVLRVLKNDSGLSLTDVPTITIFPNPLPYGQSLSIKADRNARMEIYTVLGQQIGTSLFVPANQIISCPVQVVTPGIYIARFTTGTKSIALRFIIQ